QVVVLLDAQPGAQPRGVQAGLGGAASASRPMPWPGWCGNAPRSLPECSRTSRSSWRHDSPDRTAASTPAAKLALGIKIKLLPEVLSGVIFGLRGKVRSLGGSRHPGTMARVESRNGTAGEDGRARSSRSAFFRGDGWRSYP